MRSTWKGSITFGMVNIPVKLYTATEEKSVKFKQVHVACGTPISQKRHCADCNDQVVEYEDIRKGFQLPDGGPILMMEDDDFLNLPLQTIKAVEVQAFVPADTVPILLLDKAYYAAPDGAGAKPFALLWQALQQELVAVGKVSLRSGRERTCVIRQHRNLLVLQTLLWADEVRSCAGLEEDMQGTGVEIEPAELELAQQLVQAQARDTAEEVLAEQQDNYRFGLQQVIDAKLAGKAVPGMPQTARLAPPDLLGMLQKSVEQAKEAVA